MWVLVRFVSRYLSGRGLQSHRHRLLSVMRWLHVNAIINVGQGLFITIEIYSTVRLSDNNALIPILCPNAIIALIKIITYRLATMHSYKSFVHFVRRYLFIHISAKSTILQNFNIILIANIVIKFTTINCLCKGQFYFSTSFVIIYMLHYRQCSLLELCNTCFR